jgi:hypothetical protein
VKRVFFLAILLTAGVALAARPTPLVVRDAGRIRVALPKELVSDAEIQKELRRGLTTTFMLVADTGQRRGGARIELRYELWDELYLVRAISVDGSEQKATLPSLAALAEWWNSPRVTVLVGEVPDSSLQLRLDVLPFSAGEEADAKRWLAQSANAAAESAAASSSPSATSTPLLDAVIGTSVRRKPLLSYVWRVRLSPATTSP